jgi:K+-sensing histidine kinase KdpD
MARHLSFCRNLRIPAHPVTGSDTAQAVAEYARAAGATRIYVARSAREAGRLVRLVKDMQVTIVSERIRNQGR